jgi:hypothetical protein
MTPDDILVQVLFIGVGILWVWVASRDRSKHDSK